MSSTTSTKKQAPPAGRRRGSPAQRLGSAAQLAALKTTFGILDRVAPDVAARWALRLWCTLPSSRGLRKDHRTSRGAVSEVAVPGGRTVVVETWGEGDPVYLLHGWGGWRGQLGAFVAPIVEAGRRAVALDTPSHGESAPGTLGAGRSTAVEFAEALRAVVEAHGEASGIIAHSLGCTATGLAVADGLPAERLALVAPVPTVMTLTDAMAERLGYGPRTKSRFDAKLEHLAGRPIGDFDLTGMRNLPPALVVHDRLDKEAAYADGARLAELWGADIHTTEGLGHQRILRDPDVVARVVDYVTG